MEGVDDLTEVVSCDANKIILLCDGEPVGRFKYLKKTCFS